MEKITSSPPVTDDIGTVSSRARGRAKRHKKDPRFLKKLNAPTNNTSCCIDAFVTINSSSSSGDPDVDGMDDKFVNDPSMEWKCDTCNKELLYIRKDAQRVCPSCGLSSPFQEMTKEDIVRQGYVNQATYLYKRQNHFKTWLKRTQGKETTFIDDEVIEAVRMELKKHRIEDLSTVDHVKIREILKQLRLSKHYNHCVQITTIITGETPPQMTTEQETALLQMFDNIQEPFQRIIQKEPRQNMLSYSFLIHKFLEIMSWDEYLPYFPLLRSADKIQYQDWIWQKLCAEVGFEYIKSSM
jgi:hypothetical protein